MMLSVVWWIIIAIAMSQGLAMLVRPRIYVMLCNHWYRLLGHEKRLSPERFERWPNRLGGLAMLLTGAFLIWTTLR
jgi:hypothetical protein